MRELAIKAVCLCCVAHVPTRPDLPWLRFLQKEIVAPGPMQARYKAVMQERQEADGVEAMDI